MGAQVAAWQPLVDGMLAEQVRETIDAISEGLRRDPFPPPDRAHLSPERAAQYASLALGRIGPALFFAYLSRSQPEIALDEVVQSLMAEAAASVSTPAMGLSLHLGAAGIAWTASHLQILVLTPEGGDVVSRVTAAVNAHLGAGSGWENYDLISGLVGLGVFALERLPDAQAVECLERVIGRLEALSERSDAGVTWRSIAARMPPRHRKAASDYYDLGVAHGVPGVVGLLARACAAGVGADRARPLLDSAVSWLLAQRQPAGTGARFPAWIAPDTLRHTPDPAWCYGDLGIAATVLMAARCTGEASWEDEALALARPAPTPGILSQISDAQLCHGAAGVAHLFNRMFQATGEDWLKRAALAWLRRAVDLRRPGEKLAGFSALHEARDGTVRRVAHRGFLHGVAGIGLALLAASSPIEPAWDRVLLLR